MQPSRAPGQDLWTGGAAAPPSAAPRPPRHAGRGRGRLRVTRPPRGALQPPQQHRAPHGPRRPQSALLLIVCPGKVTGALDAGPALTGSLLSVSQLSFPPDFWASLPGSPLSSPGSPPQLLGSLALSWFHSAPGFSSRLLSLEGAVQSEVLKRPSVPSPIGVFFSFERCALA